MVKEKKHWRQPKQKGLLTTRLRMVLGVSITSFQDEIRLARRLQTNIGQRFQFWRLLPKESMRLARH